MSQSLDLYLRRPRVLAHVGGPLCPGSEQYRVETAGKMQTSVPLALTTPVWHTCVQCRLLWVWGRGTKSQPPLRQVFCGRL